MGIAEGVSALILRLYRARAPLDRAAESAEILAGRFIDAAKQMRGLTSFAAGMRVDAEAVHVLLATTWDDVADVARLTDGRLERPAGPVPDFMETVATEHLELVGDPVPILVASPDAVVRVARMKVTPGREEDFYATVRRRLGEVRSTQDLLAYHLGRKVEAAGHEAVAVSVWRSVDALGEVVATDSGSPLWADALRPLLDTFEVEHFDAVRIGPA